MDSILISGKKLSWWEPRWSYVPDIWKSLRQVTQPASLVRVTLLTIAAFAVILAGVKLAIPQLQIGFVWNALLALPGIYLCLLAMMALHAAIPPEVKIYAGRITVQHGKQLRQILVKDIARARLVIFSEDRIRLRIQYRFTFWKKSQLRQQKIGVSPKVNLDKLCEVFPVTLQVRDARGKYTKRSRQDGGQRPFSPQARG